MKLDAVLSVDAAHLSDAGKIARAAEAIGFGTLWTPETKHNAFLPLVIAADHTSEIRLGTSVAIAFPRSPMVTAQIAWDLQAFSGGRFVLGLGTQVKAHIERRYGMAWEAPVPKLREYLQALQAIWHHWQTGARLNFKGRFYEHSLMSPFFNPGPISHPQIPIYIAGVNEGLARLAGELCDGFHVHPFHSVKYLRELVLPQIAVGAQKAGRDPQQVALTSSVLLITGPNEAAVENMRTFAREQIAFYASTPTYRVVLDAHGWGEIGERLSGMAAEKRWAEMPKLVTDEMLAAFAVEAPFDQLGRALRERYTGILESVSPYMPFTPGPFDEVWRTVARDMAA